MACTCTCLIYDFWCSLTEIYREHENDLHEELVGDVLLVEVAGDQGLQAVPEGRGDPQEGRTTGGETPLVKIPWTLAV